MKDIFKPNPCEQKIFLLLEHTVTFASGIVLAGGFIIVGSGLPFF